VIKENLEKETKKGPETARPKYKTILKDGQKQAQTTQKMLSSIYPP
jgi:hypothetical protein